MLRGVLHRLAAHFSKDEDAVGGEDDETRFIPSVLDASVRYAHGGANTGERELIKMQEEARRLEEQQEN